MASFKTYNPVSGAFLHEYTFATAADVSKSLENLHTGFQRWKTLSFSERQKALRPAVGLFNQSREELAKMITDEMGKPYSQSLSEIDKSLQSLEYMCTNQCPALDVQSIKTFSDPNNVSHQVYHKPKGIILGVMPWNYPFWQAVRMIFPALLAGNTVLLKHSENTPSAGEFIKKILSQVDVKNIFDHLIFEHSLTESVIADCRVQGVSLTGSVKAGFLLSEYAGKHMKRGVFELGGSDAHMVLSDANIEKSAANITKSRLQNTGQSCIAAKRVVVDAKVSRALIDQLVVNFDRYAWGDVFERSTTLGPLASARFKPEDDERFNFAKNYCEVVYERYPDETVIKSLSEESSRQAFVPLRILKAKKLNPEFLKYLKTNEFFSPTLVVLEYANLEEGLDLVNQTHFGLGGSIYSENIASAQEIALRFESGVVAVNDGVASNAMLPFGGIKSSGIGRELGMLGFTEFTDIQVVSTTRFT
jgi:succinate-semialdehyde dehydrogenase/glutarate-semialdehyde dehydrogenase